MKTKELREIVDFQSNAELPTCAARRLIGRYSFHYGRGAVRDRIT